MSCFINNVYLCLPKTDIARHIMRNRLFILFSALALSANAENISEDAARGMALDFFKNNSPQTSVSNLQMVYDGETPQTRADGSAPALYVFDNPQGKGFVIISGDDIAQPVLGYSYDNDFPKENLPVHIQGWLESLKTQINDGRKYGVEAPPTSHALTRAGQTVVKLQTAQWGQDAPFNNKCPFIGWNSTQAPSGCVITATAIVMRYHKWPSYGHGTVPGYTTATNKINRPSVTLGHYYDWESMPNKYTPGSYTNEQANQVAQLMVDLGTMFEADYTSDATSAFTDDIAYNLSTYMDYDKSALYRERYQYTDEEWHSILADELQQGRPVLYRGANLYAGHAFVLDGYTTDRYYSVNWGWDGYCNGWFLLNALRPSGSGTGGNNDHYNFGQGAVTDLKPDAGGDYIELIGLGEKGLTSEETEFYTGVPFLVSANELRNYGGGSFTGSILCALTDKSGKIIEELEVINENIEPNWGWNNYFFYCTITVPIEFGYRIRLFYKSEKTPEWTLIKAGDQCPWEILVADEHPIAESTSITFNKVKRILTVKKKGGVVAELFDEAGTDLSNLRVNVVNESSFNLKAQPAGTYTLKLTKEQPAMGINEEETIKVKLGAPAE